MHFIRLRELKFHNKAIGTPCFYSLSLTFRYNSFNDLETATIL